MATVRTQRDAPHWLTGHPSQPHHAGAGVQAGQAFQKASLAGTVLALQRKHFTVSDGKGDGVNNDHIFAPHREPINHKKMRGHFVHIHAPKYRPRTRSSRSTVAAGPAQTT